MTRRDFLVAAAALSGLGLARQTAWAQSPMPSALAPTTLEHPPTTAAARALLADIGMANWNTLRVRLATTNADVQTRGLKHIKGIDATFLTGYPYNEFYDWDLYFENLYLSYYGVSTYCFTNLKEFLNREQPDGYVNRSLIKQRDRQQFKPFLAQLAVLGSKQNHDDYEWARGNYYDRLKKYLDKWFSYDGDHNGLPVWNSADAAGTDNQWSRAGALSSFEIEGVDLASYLVRELRAMSVIAGRLGEHDDAKMFDAHADEVVKRINAIFWDDKDGMYYDRNEKTGQLVKVKSATCFTPLFAGAATKERAQRMIDAHLHNPQEFWLAYPVASYAKTEPDYYQGSHNECNWRGPTWAPTNYMIFQGLQRYGYHNLARDLATRLFTMAIVKNPVLREYYNAETGDGLGQTNFWGFTALYYIMLLEYHLRYDASSLDSAAKPIIPNELGLSFPA